MGSFSVTHWLVILGVVVLLFGAKKIPELAKGIGQGMKEFKNVMQEKRDSLRSRRKINNGSVRAKSSIVILCSKVFEDQERVFNFCVYNSQNYEGIYS